MPVGRAGGGSILGRRIWQRGAATGGTERCVAVTLVRNASTSISVIGGAASKLAQDAGVRAGAGVVLVCVLVGVLTASYDNA